MEEMRKSLKRAIGLLGVLSAALMLTGSALAEETPVHVTVHDPSIIKVEGKGYYLFGSHTASAFSEDLISWKQLNFDYGHGKDVPFYANLEESFEEPFLWAGHNDGDAGSGFAIWAPDILYDPYYVWEDGSEGAYLLYACTSSTWRRSCICYLVAKEIEGPYTYVDTVLYSGFTKTGEPDGKSTRSTLWDQDILNLKELIELGAENGGIEDVSDKWFSKQGDWDHTYAPNAIDPNLFWDASGEKLYLSYGSWSGGLWLLELDRTSGRPMYPGVDSVDEVSGNYVDRYFGIHLVGGDHASGEGPYIRYDAESGYYYLYCTYGGLLSSGGYNMRLFRSENPSGPYLDAAGNNAAENKGNQDKYGIKVMGNYAFYNQVGKKAAGHNSQFIDEDGSRYLFYHQRFDMKPQLEAHEVRVHQQFLNKEGWPVTAVYEYRGEMPELYGEEDVLGTYEFINHGTKTEGEMLPTSLLFLEEGGAVSGAATGSWSLEDSGKGYTYALMDLDGVHYSGIFFRQHKENTEEEPVMTFALIGDDNTTIWGSETEEGGGSMALETAAEELKKEIMAAVKSYGTLPSEFMGCTITWNSPDETVITNEGVVLPQTENKKVALEATLESGGGSLTRIYNVTVKAK